MLGSWLNQPLAMTLAGRSYMVRELTYGDVGMLLRNGGRALGLPDGADVTFKQLNAINWFTSPRAIPLILWAAIRRDEPFTIRDAERLAIAVEVREVAAVINHVFPSLARDQADGCPMLPVLHKLVVDRGLSPDAVADLTLAQVYALNVAEDSDPPINFRSSFEPSGN